MDDMTRAMVSFVRVLERYGPNPSTHRDYRVDAALRLGLVQPYGNLFILTERGQRFCRDVYNRRTRNLFAHGRDYYGDYRR